MKTKMLIKKILSYLLELLLSLLLIYPVILISKYVNNVVLNLICFGLLLIMMKVLAYYTDKIKKRLSNDR